MFGKLKKKRLKTLKKRDKNINVKTFFTFYGPNSPHYHTMHLHLHCRYIESNLFVRLLAVYSHIRVVNDRWRAVYRWYRRGVGHR